ncbi:hypothetical protein QFZ24_003236 [Streptomyces phaeochromogenes]|uniref:hypothetical protein n=1 Tax=Streptomyces phaeochromogenes TaxID=1923 RepID=UPI00278E942C|nr:hypothetical protein [Streptomyces phaeochromogenes]MDQ0949313.1 hypothetical protein [Streptomyces phaeochromogenes]
MTRIPDAVAVASLDTHRLIVTVPNEGPADVACNLPRPVAANILRQLAASIEGPAGHCDTALATAAPCPIHDAPASLSEAMLAAGAGAAEAFARGVASAQRPAGLDDLLAAVTSQLPDEEQQAPADWVAEVREALAFNEGAQHPAVITLRDILLDDAPRTPEQTLNAALVILAAHTRELSALAGRDADEYRAEHGVNRGTRGLITGMAHTRKLLDRHATGLDAQATA